MENECKIIYFDYYLHSTYSLLINQLCLKPDDQKYYTIFR